MKKTFKCNDCGEVKPLHTSGGTGYGITTRGKRQVKICYECCGKRDRKYMETSDRIMLYLSKIDHGGGYCALDRKDEHIRRTSYAKYLETNSHHWEVSNWPGTLKFRCQEKKGRHNIAGTRHDVWFTDHQGNEWWGVQYGEWTQICHCRKLKRKAAAA